MTLQKLLSLLPKHPKAAYEDASGNLPRREGLYIACENYDGNVKSYRLIFLDNIEHLIDFIPSLLLSNLSVLDDVNNNNLVDYKEIYNIYSTYRNLKELTPEVIGELVRDWGFIKVLNINYVSRFFNISSDSIYYIKNNPKIFEFESLEKTGLNMSEYTILSGFIKQFAAMPSEMPDQFLDYLIGLNSL